MSTSPGSSAALIDVGSTSVSLLIATRDGGGFRTSRPQKRILRLGAARGPAGQIKDQAVAQLLQVLHEFRGIAANRPLRVVATASLRGATNLSEIRQKVRAEIHCDLEVLTGEQEAAAAYRGTRLASPDLGYALVVDVGGGSTEFAWGKGPQPAKVLSVPLGVVRLQRDFIPTATPSEQEITAAVDFARRAVSSLPEAPGGNAVACSGTLKRLCGLASGQFPPARDASLDRAGLEEVWDRLLVCGPSGPTQLPGVDPARSDLLLPGALLFRVLSDELRVTRWSLTAGGLRWGLMDELLSD